MAQVWRRNVHGRVSLKMVPARPRARPGRGRTNSVSSKWCPVLRRTDQPAGDGTELCCKTCHRFLHAAPSRLEKHRSRRLRDNFRRPLERTSFSLCDSV